MDSYLAESTRAPWRKTATVALAMALLVGAVGLTVRYRHDHRDEWVRRTEPWWGFDVSGDGRTLTFHGRGVGPCTEAAGVRFSSDPTQGGQIQASLKTRTQVMRDGHALFCDAVLAVDGPTEGPAESITFDRPVPDGTVISDGMPSDGF
ncbi:MAG: hypothetical protein ACXWA3_10040, partial [Acidimicrobiales bacterium]